MSSYFQHQSRRNEPVLSLSIAPKLSKTPDAALLFSTLSVFIICLGAHREEIYKTGL